ncbi:hypothetical protein AQUCO_06500041v1 [Aquilegia coerulea]|uniref:Cytochrome P450 n=1 Tax=Aquilegia coerulea TaxID=218851 RepID=A0A2G5CDL7_AQUCA|nr:hypothetical protein AQUCO_06500041v1 [Aquilegia coerulea]
MEWYYAFIIWPSVCLVIAFLVISKSKNKGQGQRPPGPPGWPVIGNIFDLGVEPHRSLARLSRKYGPIMWLRFGAKNTLVVSSAEVAMEMFKKHDLTISDRAINECFKLNKYDQVSMGVAPYGTYWRMMRQLFSNNRIKATEKLRTRSMDNMIKWIWNNAQEKGSVEIARFTEIMVFNAIGNAIFSKDIVYPHSEKGKEFFTATAKILEFITKPNVADFFPWMRWLDPQRVKKKVKQLLGITIGFSFALVKERILDRQIGKRNEEKDFLDVMLDFQGNRMDGEPTKLPEINISIGILHATDTTTDTVEWAMTELLRNPRVMRKAEVELDQVVGRKRKLEEGDIKNLHYLQAVVKETLRLHPVVPFLVPRSVREDMEFMGYLIPKNTQIFVNVWAIARDPTSWDDPISFKPERFLNSDVDYKGRHFQFLPFGAGRRICVGLPFAERMLHLTIGSLIQSFEWALEDGITPEKISVKESFGLALRKADPLKVVLRPKLHEMQENVAQVQ